MIVIVSSEEYLTDRLSKRPKMKIDDDFLLTLTPRDRHCIANCFAVHFEMELDKVLYLLETEFRENTSVYTAFSIFSDDEIIKEVYQYITEKRYDSTTADLFLYAFSRIFNTKVVVTYADGRKEDTIIGAEVKKTIHLFKYQDHFDLFEQTSSNTSASLGECTKSTSCKNSQEKERNPSNNEISLNER